MIEDDIHDWPATSIGRKLADLDKNLRCPICQEIFQNASTLLKCGHCFCCECISRECEKPSKATCPICHMDTCLSEILASRILRSVVECFKFARSDILSLVCDQRENIESDTEERSTLSLKRNRTRVTDDNMNSNMKRIPVGTFHGKNREQIKKDLEKLCIDCKTKIRTDGDREKLILRYKDFIRLYNSQIDALHPLSKDEIVQEITKREIEKEKYVKKTKETIKIVESLKSGKVNFIYIYININNIYMKQIFIFIFLFIFSGSTTSRN